MVRAGVLHIWKKPTSHRETGKKERDIVRETLAQYLDRTDPDSVESLMMRAANLER